MRGNDDRFEKIVKELQNSFPQGWFLAIWIFPLKCFRYNFWIRSQTLSAKRASCQWRLVVEAKRLSNSPQNPATNARFGYKRKKTCAIIIAYSCECTISERNGLQNATDRTTQGVSWVFVPQQLCWKILNFLLDFVALTRSWWYSVVFKKWIPIKLSK